MLEEDTESRDLVGSDHAHGLRESGNDHGSSFDSGCGCRQGTRFRAIEIPCVTIDHPTERFFLPRCLQVDVEGADKLIHVTRKSELTIDSR